MKCVFLAAGYATRLYPLTENFPKPLLKVGGKAILDHLVDDLEAGGSVDGYVVVTNHKFAPHFREWAASHKCSIEVVDDMTSTNETRLGAVRDMELALNSVGADDDVLVLAGDNVLDFSLNDFVSYASMRKASCILRYFEPEGTRLHKSAVVEVAPDDRVLSMEEKPSEPKSHWCCPPFYYYTSPDAHRVAEGIAAGCGVDAPGSYAAWLSTVAPVYAMEMPGHRFDIGNLDSYRAVCEEFEK